MPTEKYANAIITTLSSSINNSVTSFSVASVAGMPSSGNFRILIDSEIMLVTNVSGTTLTVTRGQEGTSAASHSSGASVVHLITKGALDQLYAEMAYKDTFDNRPAVERAGKLFFPTNAPFIGRDSGSGWDNWGPLSPLGAEVVSGDFSWINQGGATISTSRGGVLLTAPASSGDNLRIRKKSAPSTPYTITAAFVAHGFPSNHWSAGLLFRQSSDGKLHIFSVGHTTVGASATGSFSSSKFTSVNAFGSHYDNRAIAGVVRPVLFMRIEDNGTDRICSFSCDGITFQQFHSVDRTDFLTANEVGFFANSNNSKEATIHILSWVEE